MKKILVIDDSTLFRDYITSKLVEKGFEAVGGSNGLDGSVKMRSEMPDLIILDYAISRKSSLEILKEKKENPNVSSIPVIMVATKIDKSELVKAAQYDVKKFFTKPVRMDALLKAVSALLQVEVEIDTTPCIIEAHLNDEILFVEIARGLNFEKIELLRYRIKELLDLYDLNYPRVLVMMTDVEITEDDQEKFERMIDLIIEYAGPYAKHMKILTKSEVVSGLVRAVDGYSMIEVTDDLSKAMDDLLGMRPDNVAHDEVVRRTLLSTSKPKKEREDTFELRFEGEATSKSGDSTTEAETQKRVAIAVVDDDPIIRQLIQTVFAKTGWGINPFENGKKFVDAIPKNGFDLVFLDLMMPEMDGFQVLLHLRNNKIVMPVIVLSALSKQETVVKAMQLGVHSFLTKPFQPAQLIRKSADILNANF